MKLFENFTCRSLLQDNKKPSNLIDSKHGKQNVRFAQDTTKGISVQSSVKPTMTSATAGNFLSPLQVSAFSSFDYDLTVDVINF